MSATWLSALRVAERKIPRGAGEKNAAAKLSADEVREIRRLAKRGVDQYELARRFGINQSHVNHIVRRLNWAHLE